MGEIKLDGYLCERCDHTWISRVNTIIKPKVCPKCKSPYWDTPRKKPTTEKIEKLSTFEKEAKPKYGLFP